MVTHTNPHCKEVWGGGAAELEIARWGRRERAGSDSWNVKPGLPGNKRVRSRSHTVTFATLPQLRYLPELALPCLHNPDWPTEGGEREAFVPRCFPSSYSVWPGARWKTEILCVFGKSNDIRWIDVMNHLRRCIYVDHESRLADNRFFFLFPSSLISRKLDWRIYSKRF